jgi:hypothetical protein
MKSLVITPLVNAKVRNTALGSVVFAGIVYSSTNTGISYTSLFVQVP